MTVMDQRIGDLRERLHKKRAEVGHLLHLLLFLLDLLLTPPSLCHLQLNRMNGGGGGVGGGGASPGRVAAVCPYIQVPEGRQEAEPPTKPTPLCHIRSLSGWWTEPSRDEELIWPC